MRTAVAAIAVVSFAACRFDLPDTGLRTCTKSDSSCVCLLPDGICVTCTAIDERNCTGKTPHCGSDHLCHACRFNDDCASSGACLEDGACADISKIIYASPTGVTMPGCGIIQGGANECSIAQALAEVNGQRYIIRLAPGTYTLTGSDGLDFNNKNATVIARSATVKNSTNPGTIMTARNNGSLKLIGGTLQGPNGSDGSGATRVASYRSTKRRSRR